MSEYFIEKTTDDEEDQYEDTVPVLKFLWLKYQNSEDRLGQQVASVKMKFYTRTYCEGLSIPEKWLIDWLIGASTINTPKKGSWV